MIVDTSALIAVLASEPESDAFLGLLTEAPQCAMSTAMYVEAAVIVDRLRDPAQSRRFDDLLSVLDISLVPVTVEHAHLARAAYRDFGKGSGHPARLNFGDCFSYALARATREPLLFKGDDFVHTDLVPAYRS